MERIKKELRTLKSEEDERAEELILEKEARFMERYIPFLECLCEELGISACDIRIDDMGIFEQELSNIFLSELLEDEEFLKIKIKEHFELEDETDVFGLELIYVQEMCPCCNNQVEEWLAITVNGKENTLGLGYVKCSRKNRVEISEFRHDTVENVIDFFEDDFYWECLYE